MLVEIVPLAEAKGGGGAGFDQVTAPNLADYMSSERPAWLWDGERARIVWASAEGVRWFGGETLFDLIDQPFDAEGSANRLNFTAGKGAQQVVIAPAAADGAQLALRVEELEDDDLSTDDDDEDREVFA